MTSVETVRAAGALVHRRVHGELQVLLVHHAVHGDWGWPKGKPEPGEALPTAAVREVAEETGVGIRLGAPLPGTAYVLPDGRPKKVVYWAAEVTGGGIGTPSPDEIDDVAWLPVDRARARLSREQDLTPLEAVLEREAAGTLETWPLVLLRHATAVKRSRWDGDEASRPLTPAGREGALALASLLPAWDPHLVITSPWERCLQTVLPLAQGVPLPLREDPRLTEEGAVQHVGAARAWLDAVVAIGVPAVVCTHRPLLPALFEAVLLRADAPTGPAVPRTRPLLEKGELAVLHVRTGPGSGHPIVALETHESERR